MELTSPIIKQWVDELTLWSRDMTALSDYESPGNAQKAEKEWKESEKIKHFEYIIVLPRNYLSIFFAQLWSFLPSYKTRMFYNPNG